MYVFLFLQLEERLSGSGAERKTQFLSVEPLLVGFVQWMMLVEGQKMYPGFCYSAVVTVWASMNLQKSQRAPRPVSAYFRLAKN